MRLLLEDVRLSVSGESVSCRPSVSESAMSIIFGRRLSSRCGSGVRMFCDVDVVE